MGPSSGCGLQAAGPYIHPRGPKARRLRGWSRAAEGGRPSGRSPRRAERTASCAMARPERSEGQPQIKKGKAIGLL